MCVSCFIGRQGQFNCKTHKLNGKNILKNNFEIKWTLHLYNCSKYIVNKNAIDIKEK